MSSSTVETSSVPAIGVAVTDDMLSVELADGRTIGAPLADTEIERRYFHDLQPHIARAYHLNYDDQRKRTVAEVGYFWD